MHLVGAVFRNCGALGGHLKDPMMSFRVCKCIVYPIFSSMTSSCTNAPPGPSPCFGRCLIADIAIAQKTSGIRSVMAHLQTKLNCADFERHGNSAKHPTLEEDVPQAGDGEGFG